MPSNDRAPRPAKPISETERRQCLGAAYRILLAAVARQRALNAQTILPTEASDHDNLRHARRA